MLWYLAHPVAPDERYSYEDNIADGRRWWARLLRANVSVCAPWFGLCHALDDSKPEDRALGMKIDQAVLARCDGIIATGHRVSSGMQKEIESVEARNGEVVRFLHRYEDLVPAIFEDLRTMILLAEASCSSKWHETVAR